MQNDVKTALITGASSGIGRATAIWFAKRGTKVYAAARRASMLEELAKGGHGEILPMVLDVTREQQTVDAIQKLDDDCGGLDLVLANAGVGDLTPAQSSNWAQVEKVLKVNVMGAAATLTAVIPRMVARGRGRLAGLSSIGGYRGVGNTSAYAGSKAFLSVFLEAIRVDLHGTPLTVTCIEAGFIQSEMSDKLAGIVPMPFKMSSEDAAAKIGHGILNGTRVVAFPWVHALGANLMLMVPSPIFDPLAKRAADGYARAMVAANPKNQP